LLPVWVQGGTAHFFRQAGVDRLAGRDIEEEKGPGTAQDPELFAVGGEGGAALASPTN
jgi:hypothetical protein